MTTLFTATGLFMRIQSWIDGSDRTLTLKQLNNLYLQIDALLIWETDIDASLAPNVRRLLDNLDHAYDAIVQEVSA